MKRRRIQITAVRRRTTIYANRKQGTEELITEVGVAARKSHAQTGLRDRHDPGFRDVSTSHSHRLITAQVVHPSGLEFGTKRGRNPSEK